MIRAGSFAYIYNVMETDQPKRYRAKRVIRRLRHLRVSGGIPFLKDMVAICRRRHFDEARRAYRRIESMISCCDGGFSELLHQGKAFALKKGLRFNRWSNAYCVRTNLLLVGFCIAVNILCAVRFAIPE